MERLDAEGRIWYPTSTDKRPRLKRYLDEMPGTLVGDFWGDISPINSQAMERIGYPTQKPVALLERIIRASSNEGDLVLDCVCGSGTSAVASEQLSRRWIAADLGRFAIHTTRKRVLGLANVRRIVDARRHRRRPAILAATYPIAAVVAAVFSTRCIA